MCADTALGLASEAQAISPVGAEPYSSEASATPRTLAGRDRELFVVDEFLLRAGERGAALFLHGEAGVGKTRLLDIAAERAAAAGFRVLRDTSPQFQAQVSFGSLSRLLLPLSGGFSRLVRTHRDALMRALGTATGPAPDRLLIFNACLALVSGQARERPLLFVVDDLQWMDPASTTALGFIARRLDGTRVGVLTASRTQDEDPFRRAGLPRLQVRPLNDSDATGLLRDAFPEMSAGVRQRVVAESRGNPLALLELPAALTPMQIRALESLPDVLPLTGNVEAAFAARIDALPFETRRALVVLAEAGTGDLGVLQLAVPDQPVLDQLAPAERARLVKVDMATRRVIFRHPLLRSAVVESCTDIDIRHIHRSLAELFVHDPDRAAWHLALAASGPDGHVATLVEESAHRKILRGDAVGAARALTRAAHLSEDVRDRSRRLAETAYLAACVLGEQDTASRLLAESRQLDPGHGGSLHAAAATACLMLNGTGDASTAHTVLVRALEDANHGWQAGRKDLLDALDMLLTVCRVAGREDYWKPLRQAVSRLGPKPPEAVLLTSRIFPDPVRATAEDRRRLSKLVDVRNWTEAPYQTGITSAAVYFDLFDGCRSHAWRIVENSRTGGAVRIGLTAMAHLSMDGFATGRWREAERLADEGLALAESHGYTFVAWSFLYQKAMLTAVRGEVREARQWADRLTAVTKARQAEGSARTVGHPLALAALAEDDFEAAYRHASLVGRPGELSADAPWVALDLVEAAVRSGRISEAQVHVRALRESGVAKLSPRLKLLAQAAQAMVAPDDEALILFEQAVSVAGAGRWPFDYARAQLLFGERLRRMRSAAEAYTHLNTALGVFRRLGAMPWEHRAAEELRAAGRSTAGTGAAVNLTAQELEIASLAAEGLTNKQIGERLYLSPRTVGTHLYRIFPKLGIASRAALRDALLR
jgi:DNA-binding CsgD family transcriptional regulator